MIIIQVLAILAVFTAVVAIHELGHYLFARWRKMDVEEFAIGFGPKAFGVRSKSGTLFAFRMVPLGGFVRIKGMEPKPDGSEISIEGGFYSKGLKSRAIVLFAGPLFSVLFGYFVYWGAIAISGDPRPTSEPIVGVVFEKVKDEETGIEEETPAFKAGLKPGDLILSVNGETVKSFYDFRLKIRESVDIPMQVVVQRNGTIKSLTITPVKKFATLSGPDGLPETNPDGSPKRAEAGWIGAMHKNEFVKVGFLEAGRISFERCVMLMRETVRVLLNPNRLKEEIGGPITIGRLIGAAATDSIPTLVSITAFISLSLGLINLIPIPIFDGGQLVIVGIEALRRGKRIPFKTQLAWMNIGFLLLIMIIISVLVLDINRMR